MTKFILGKSGWGYFTFDWYSVKRRNRTSGNFANFLAKYK